MQIRNAISAATLVLAFASAVRAQEGLHWQPSLDAAMQVAKQSNRYVLVHFWTKSCRPCAKLERDVFALDGVAQAVDTKFVPVKMDADQHQERVREWGVTTVPTDIILTADGKLVAKLPVNGNSTPVQYLAQLDRATLSPGGQVAQSKPGADAVPVAHSAPTVAATPSPSVVASPEPSASVAASAPVQVASAPEWARPEAALAGAEAPWAKQATAVTPPAAAESPTAPWASPTIPNAAAAVGTATVQQSVAPRMPSRPSTGHVASDLDDTATTPAQPDYAPAAVAQVSTPALPPAAAQSPMMPPRPQPQAQMQASAPVQPTMPTAAPPKPPRLALSGHCVVSLFDQQKLPVAQQKWVPGDKRWGAVHLGQVYLFASQENQRRFLQSPFAFAPALNGADAVINAAQGIEVPGQAAYGVMYNDRMYLFANAQTLQQFEQSPQRYADSVMQAERPLQTRMR